MKTGKFILSLILCLTLAGGLVSLTSAGTATPALDSGYEFALPLTEEKQSFTVAVTAHAQVSKFDASENLFTKWFEDQTNVHFDFEVFPAEQQAAAVNTYLAAGRYADIMMFQSVGEFPTATMYSYAKNGSFIPLTEMIDTYGVWTQNLFERKPLMRDALTQVDGEIYTLPCLNDVQHQWSIDKAFVYTPFLEAVGITELPDTLDEFKEMLIAFRDGDPNKNGINDEIPAATYYTNDYVSFGAGVEAYLMDAFIVTSKMPELKYTTVRNNEIIAGFMTDEWRDGLRWIKTLYDEKLIAPESFTQDATQFLAMGENPDAPILSVALCGQPPRFITCYGESGRWLDYECLPALIGPSGKQETLYNPYFGFRLNAGVISSTCKDPVLAFKALDYMLNEEASMNHFYGIGGWSVDDIPEDGIAVNGGKATWRQTYEFGVETTYNWLGVSVLGLTMEMRTSELASAELPLEPWLFNETAEKYLKYRQPDSDVMPFLHYEESEAEEVLDIATTVNRYVAQMVVAFVTGTANIETEWDGYLNTLKSMDVDRCLEIMNKDFAR